MKRGITIIALVATIVVLSIISGAVLYTSKSTMEKVNKNEFVIEFLNIETALNNYYDDYGKYPVNSSISVNIGDFSDFEKSQFNDETISNNMVTLYVINLELIGINKTIFGNDKEALDKYVLSKETGKVYYLLGIEYDDETHYTLNSKIYDDYIDGKVNNEYKRIKIKDVEFYVSNLEKTSKSVDAIVMLPEEATITSVLATNEVVVGDEVIENNIKKVPVNTTNLVCNYSITVEYTILDESKTVIYEVKNVDNVGPDITITTVNESGYTNLEIAVTDDGSGVDVIKYDFAAVSDGNYFDNFGKTVTGTVVKCTQSGTYTIYAKDKVGNVTLKQVTITIS